MFSIIPVKYLLQHNPTLTAVSIAKHGMIVRDLAVSGMHTQNKGDLYLGGDAEIGKYTG